MITSDYKPLLRQNIELIPANVEGNDVILLRDKEGITNQTLVMPLEAIILLQFLNGSNSIKDIQSKILKITNHLVSDYEIIEFIKRLDESNFLENEKTMLLRRSIVEEFKNSSVRKMRHAGLSYPQNILEVSSFMSKFYSLKDNPVPIKNITGIIAPHIDLIRGGDIYARSYGELSESYIPDLIIAFGVSHYGGNSPFIFTKKDYETPYGNVSVNLDVYNRFKDILYYEIDEEEYLHRNEHSLEFQALWLKYIWRDKTPQWIPILVSDFERFANEDNPPSKIEYIEKFFNDSKSIIDLLIGENKKLLILMGVDLSHIGKRFGDDIEITEEIKNDVKGFDERLLSSISNLRYDEFFSEVAKTGNKNKICGLSAIYSGLRFISLIKPDARGTVLGYSQADDPFGGFVSFASVVFQ